MSSQFCSSCGEKVPVDSQFCANCGKAVNQAEQQPAPEITEMNASQKQTVKPKNKTWLYVIIVAAIAIFVIVTFVNPGPEKVAEEFVLLVGSFEFEEALKLTSSHDDLYMREEIEYVLEEMRNSQIDFKEGLKLALGEGFEVESFTIHDNDQTENTSTITGQTTHKNGEQNPVYIELVKESGKWKVSYMN